MAAYRPQKTFPALTCALAVIAALVFFSCDDGNPSSGNSGGGNGDDSSGIAVSPGITLPAGVTLDSVSGDMSVCITNCAMQLDYACLAACGDSPTCVTQCYADAGCFIGAFTISLTLTNNNSSAKSVLIGAGTVFEPNSGDAQNMMVLQEETFEVDPGTEQLCLPVYCLNADLGAPDAGFVYSIEDSSALIDSCLHKVLDLSKGKTISTEQAQQVQLIIWKCRDTEDEPTQADWEYLENL
ncbi:MAG: hypothetical protein GF418_09195 [Chitinivibrionales bacterium]|nr:hypothetical protein [Chitinivibrionales bacterium]MBD3395783.1 hypothetical protein [Chitinivibrionales bacterium]